MAFELQTPLVAAIDNGREKTMILGFYCDILSSEFKFEFRPCKMIADFLYYMTVDVRRRVCVYLLVLLNRW